MELPEARLRDLINAISDNPTVVTYGGEDYDVLASGITTTEPLVSGGWDERPGLRVLATMKKLDANGDLVDMFTAGNEPQENDTVTVQDTTYRIIEIVRDLWDADERRHLIHTWTLEAA